MHALGNHIELLLGESKRVVVLYRVRHVFFPLQWGAEPGAAPRTCRRRAMPVPLLLEPRFVQHLV